MNGNAFHFHTEKDTFQLFTLHLTMNALNLSLL